MKTVPPPKAASPLLPQPRFGRPFLACILTIAVGAGIVLPGQPLPAPAPATELFVAPNGDDRGPGSKESPFATLERARDALRGRKNKGGCTVFLRGGAYIRRNSFRLERQDSGEPTAPVTYQAFADEKAQLLGGAQLRFADFVPVTDEVARQRLPDEARNHVRQVDLRALGITEYGTLPLYGHGMHALDACTPYKTGPPMPELFVGDRAMTLARWPNQGYAKIERIVENGSVPRNWLDDMKGRDDSLAKYVSPEKRENPPKGFAFQVAGDRLARWTAAEDPWMFGYWFWDWSDQAVQIKAVHPETQTIESLQPSCYGLKTGQRFCVYNLIEELDTPGEWYLDRKRGLLYFYPPAETTDATAVFLSLCPEPLIVMEDVSHVVWRGLSLGVTRDNGVTVAGGERIRIDRCDIGLLGGAAITISNGKRHGVTECVIHDTGKGGIGLTGGDRQTLEPAGHYAERNEIVNFTRIAKTYAAAVSLSGVGNRAAGNRISGGTHAAILFHGNDHLIEGNEISAVCREADDMGAIYAGRDHTARGTVIRNNYIHDIRSDSSAACGSHALYLDDGFSGTTFTGNLVVNVSGMGVLINGGRDTTVTGNTFVRTRAAVAISDCRMDKRFATNNRPALPAEIDFHSAPYRKYPHLDRLLEEDPEKPRYNLITNNNCFDTQAFYFWHFQTSAREADIREWNTVYDNPAFEIGPPQTKKEEKK